MAHSALPQENRRLVLTGVQQSGEACSCSYQAQNGTQHCPTQYCPSLKTGCNTQSSVISDWKCLCILATQS